MLRVKPAVLTTWSVTWVDWQDVVYLTLEKDFVVYLHLSINHSSQRTEKNHEHPEQLSGTFYMNQPIRVFPFFKLIANLAPTTRQNEDQFYGQTSLCWG